MDSTSKETRARRFEGEFGPDPFSRLDEADDASFYAIDRFVSHLDSLALSTVEKLIGTLVKETRPVVLDLMASWDSHLPKSLLPERVVGLGLNERELARNEALTEFVLHDLNRTPILPFSDETFDAVINTVSVDYMTKPFDVFREVGRILKRGGLFLVIFSNRMFHKKAVKAWREADEERRVEIVATYFRSAGLFEEPMRFVSKGSPRPSDDKYAHLGIPSDPIYAVYAHKNGGDAPEEKRPLSLIDRPPSS